jgi:hypothetical protein
MAATSSRSPPCDKRRGQQSALDQNARPVWARMKHLYRSAYPYRSRTFGRYEMAKRDNTDCKQIAVQESLQIREPRLLVAVSVGYAACAA